MSSSGVSFEGRKIVYRASALGSCPKALAYARQGYDPAPDPKRMVAVFEKGNETEDRVIAELRKSYAVSDQQQTVELPLSGLGPEGYQVVVRGHIDCTLSDIDPWGRATTLVRREARPAGSRPGSLNYVVGEIKSQGQWAWEEFERTGFDGGMFVKYRWQASVYHHALGRPLCFIRARRDADDIVFHDPMPEDWYYTVEQIHDRVAEIERYARLSLLPEECEEGVQFPCPFYPFHPVEVEEALDGDQAADLLPCVEEYAELAAQREICDKRMTELREAVQVSLEILDRERVVLPGGHRVNLITRTSKTLNKARLNKAGVDLEQYYDLKTSKYATITPVKIEPLEEAA